MSQTASAPNRKFVRYSLATVAIFALAPGAALLALPYLLKPLHGAGATIVLATYFVIEAALLFAVIAIVARRERHAILDVIGYNAPIAIWAFLALAAFGAAYAIYMRDFFSLPALQQVSAGVHAKLPGWPSMFMSLPQHNGPFDAAGRGAAKLAILVSMLSVAAASAMQTLYFRGFLLSRLDHLGIAAPVFITALFVVFHMGSPWLWPQFLLLTASWAFIAYFSKNVWIVLVSHVVMNTYNGALALVGSGG